LENFGAKIEILNPHEALILGKTPLKGSYVSSTDLR
jgi:UDP-N-acetylglucosamine enolpyruvyl transferase